MAVGTGYSKVATSGLVFAYDTGDTYNSYLGRPTTNILANAGMSTYNNVPGNVSSNLYTTSETYRGATVWRQDLTALDGSGAYYLSNGNNPGIGVVTGGGGGNANQYSGHTIYFKPTVPMSGCPCYTNYSNIGGWQSSCNIENMGDGWFRAYVLWYDTVSRSDGKYWAINPASTGVGQTVTIYWAGPFREDLNSTSISQFVNGSRSTSQAVIDVGAGSNITVVNSPFDSAAINPQLNFNGINTYAQISGFNNKPITAITCETIIYPQRAVTAGTIRGGAISSTNSMYLGIFDSADGGSTFGSHWALQTSTGARPSNTNGQIPRNQYTHLVGTYDGSTSRAYINGVEIWNSPLTGTIADATYVIGTYGLGLTDGVHNFNGYIPVSKIYNRALSLSEIRDNYSHYKTRFNLP